LNCKLYCTVQVPIPVLYRTVPYRTVVDCITVPDVRTDSPTNPYLLYGSRVVVGDCRRIAKLQSVRICNHKYNSQRLNVNVQED
jgi:hypothetical protein